jgi:hypothetical protein
MLTNVAIITTRLIRVSWFKQNIVASNIKIKEVKVLRREQDIVVKQLVA